MWSKQLKAYFHISIEGSSGVSLRCKGCEREFFYTHHAPIEQIEVEASIHAFDLCPQARSTWRLLRREGRL